MSQTGENNGAAGGGANTTETGATGANGGANAAGGGAPDFHQAELQRARGEAADFRTQLRDAQKKLEEIAEKERLATEEAARQNGEFEKLYTSSQAEIAALKAKADRADELEKQMGEIEAERRKDLIGQLPEAMRKEFEGEGITTAEIARAVKLFGSTQQQGRSSTSGSQAAGGDTSSAATKGLWEMTPEERTTLKQSDPERYQKLLLEATARK